MIAFTSSASPHKAWWLALGAALLGLALNAHGAIAQWAGYHAFADARHWLGVPNAENVLSNLPFLIVGAWGWTATRGSPAWRTFSLALVGTAFGSALYHWSPDNASLVGDRLPIAWACAALLCGLMSERVDARWSSLGALSAALIVASGSVAWWWLGERQGHGDLRAYLFVQFLPMLLVPLALLTKMPARGARAVPDATWWTVLALYAAAKLVELADHAVLEALIVVSGHTLKHLLAAAAALCLLRGARSGAELQLR